MPLTYISMDSRLIIALVFCLGSLLPPAHAEELEIVGRLQPPARDLPVDRADVVSFVEGNGVDRQPALATLPDGGFVLVYSRYARGDKRVPPLQPRTSAGYVMCFGKVAKKPPGDDPCVQPYPSLE